MTDRPIIFSAPMVRAMLDGRKTQTRRVLKEPAPYDDGDDIDAAVVTGFIAPKYRARDRLWVRETCATWGRGPDREPVEYPVAYAADDPEWEGIKHDARHSRGDEWKIRPSIHMPRWASRLTLTFETHRQNIDQINQGDMK